MLADAGRTISAFPWAGGFFGPEPEILKALKTLASIPPPCMN